MDEEDEVQNSTSFICIGTLAKDRTFLGAVTCKVELQDSILNQFLCQDDCEGASACFRSCMIHSKIAFDPLKNTFPNKSEVQDLTEVLGFNATIRYETQKPPQHHRFKFNEYLAPPFY